MLEQVVEHDLERPRLEEGGAGFSGHGDERQEHLRPVGPQERRDREGSRWQRSAQRCHAGGGRSFNAAMRRMTTSV